MTRPTPNDGVTWRHSNRLVGSALSVLVVFESVVLSSDLDDGVRYGVDGAIVGALMLGVGQLSINRREP